MKRHIIWQLAAVLTAVSISSARSEDAVKELFGKIIGSIGDEISKDIGRGFDRLRNPPKDHAANQPAADLAGYCQVWRGGSLAAQMQCASQTTCGNDGACVYRYVWPSGGETTVVVQAGMPRSFNGKPTSLIKLGSDVCLVDTPSDIFCYTAKPQSPYAAALVTESAPPISGQALLPPTPQALPTSGEGFETLLQGYVAATENQADPNARTQRCRIGATLVREHSGSLDSELEGLILDQMKQDGCQG
ncbi:MAG: hypothetical protein ABIK36_07715 [Pseudomonadota bacterium]